MRLKTVPNHKTVDSIYPMNAKDITTNKRAGSHARLDTLSPAKRALLEKRLAQARKRSVKPQIPLRQGDSEAPLSLAQQGIWFLNQWAPNFPVFNRPTPVHIIGPLNSEILKQALEEILRRHQPLRTVYQLKKERLVQIVREAETLGFPLVDLCGFPCEERFKKAKDWIRKNSSISFDLVHGPPFRVSLLRLAPEEHVLALTVHHLSFDAWSAKVLIRELRVLYNAFLEEKKSPLPDLPVTYSDFANWQQDRLNTEEAKQSLAFWQKTLNGPLPVLELPTDRPRSRKHSLRSETQTFILPRSIVADLTDLGASQTATLFMVLLAAFKILLFRYTGQEDIIVGTPVTGRSSVETEGLIGMFVNQVALRTDLSGNPSFRKLLTGVRKTAAKAFAHQGTHFEEVMEILNPRRDLSHTPVFQVRLNLENIPEGAAGESGLTFAELTSIPGSSIHDLTLELSRTGTGLTGIWVFNADLFKKSTIERMADNFQTLLLGIVANPGRLLSELPLITEPVRHRMLIKWNDTQREYPRERSLHKQFEIQAEIAPEAIAVVFKDQSLTYGELNLRANQVARFLRNRRVKKGDPVGICMDPSPYMIVGMMGILKAGGSYVPLDPTFPGERQVFILEDTGAKIVLTLQHLLKTLPPCPAEKVSLDSDWALIGNKCDENLSEDISGEHVAYIMYTSGSTGIPKGVKIPHRAVNRLVINTNYVALTPEDRVLQASNFSFDAATFEIWGALCNGARLILAERNDILSPQELSYCLQKHRITTMFLTTALFNQLARQSPWVFHPLKQLLFGGEAVDTTCAKKVLSSHPPQRMLNVYGPTETTTFATYHEIKANDKKAQNIPIGRPIANTEVYILDRYLNPVPIGVPGEMYIGGDGLAQGYLNRPELTAERFMPHPFRSSRNAHLYKTGDLARFQPNGNIEFLGRMDNQVKIRGFRIEPCEIETAIRKYEGVEQAVAVAREDIEGDKRLVAYCVSGSGTRINTLELRRFLEQILPEYMVPSDFVIMDSLPLTRNGKVDQNALPEPARTRQGFTGYVKPQNALEGELAEIWADLLGLKRVGSQDNFFDLGGHSLLATQVVSRIRDRYHVALPLRSLFEAPTLSGFATLLSKERTKNTRLSKSQPHEGVRT